MGRLNHMLSPKSKRFTFVTVGICGHVCALHSLTLDKGVHWAVSCPCCRCDLEATYDGTSHRNYLCTPVNGQKGTR